MGSIHRNMKTHILFLCSLKIINVTLKGGEGILKKERISEKKVWEPPVKAKNTTAKNVVFSNVNQFYVFFFDT